MKATINNKGCLVIESETGIESYALRKWINECSIQGSNSDEFNILNVKNISFDCSK